jgi:hypothetical protein
VGTVSLTEFKHTLAQLADRAHIDLTQSLRMSAARLDKLIESEKQTGTIQLNEHLSQMYLSKVERRQRSLVDLISTSFFK